METLVRSVGQILEERTQFAVPVFQRHYVWAEKTQLAPLWEDLLDNLEEALELKPKRYPHYMGALIFTSGSAPIGRVPVKQVIDGQQRLTTFQVLLFAIAEIARQQGLEQVRDTARSYVRNDRESLMQDAAVERHKVLPTAYDRAVYEDIGSLSERELSNKYSSFYWGSRLAQNRTPKLLLAYFFFVNGLKQLINDQPERTASEVMLAVLDVVLTRFSIVVISLSDEDDAQTIFSTLNARGEPLNATDLIRNDIFHRALRTRESAETLFADHWGRFEQPFWEVPERQGRVLKPRLEFFFANFLVVQLQREVNLSKIYPEYRAHTTYRRYSTVKEELTSLENFAQPYQQLVERGGDGSLAEFAEMMAAFDTTTVFPAALAIAVHADPTEQPSMLNLLTSYIVRRVVCSLDAKNLTKNTVALVSHLAEHGHTQSSVEQFFAAQRAESARFPNDAEFGSAFLTKEVYGGGWDRRTRALLTRLDAAAQDRFDDSVKILGDQTLEHVMPVRWAKHWPLADDTISPTDLVWDLGLMPEIDDERRVEIQERARTVNTIGNLVLVNQAKNSKLSNAAFDDKRALLADSAFKLTRQVGHAGTWDEDAIKKRSRRLADLAISIWPDVH